MAIIRSMARVHKIEGYRSRRPLVRTMSALMAS
ncbi:hypothetical protein X772_33735 [Mesorhizobium sp. LSJC280B00]|nr:hypothetical protein X772_33735 [Mesorhizobium sp. LSJC280B00]